MGQFEVEFRDGRKVTKEANTADDAKRAAKTERTADLPRDTPRSAAELMVKRVTRLE